MKAVSFIALIILTVLNWVELAPSTPEAREVANRGAARQNVASWETEIAPLQRMRSNEY